MIMLGTVLRWIFTLIGVLSGVGSAVLLIVAARKQDTYLLTASLFLFITMFVSLCYSSFPRKGDPKSNESGK